MTPKTEPKKAPAFPFYVKDWDDYKVQRMSYHDQGVLLKIMCFMWKDSPDQCSLPNNERMMRRALKLSPSKFSSTWKEIQNPDDPIFLINGGRIICKRLKEEAEKLRKYKEMQSRKGKIKKGRKKSR